MAYAQMLDPIAARRHRRGAPGRIDAKREAAPPRRHDALAQRGDGGGFAGDEPLPGHHRLGHLAWRLGGLAVAAVRRRVTHRGLALVRRHRGPPPGTRHARPSFSAPPPMRGAGGRVGVVRLFGDQRLRRQDQGCHRNGVAHGADADLHRIDDAGRHHVDECRLRASRPVPGAAAATRLTVASGSRPQLAAMQASGCASAVSSRAYPCRALADRPSGGVWTDGAACSRAVPPPGTMPSSIAARAALIASSISCARRFCATGVAPPARMMAVPPESFASRSCSLSFSMFGGAARLPRHLLPPRRDRRRSPPPADDHGLVRGDAHLPGAAEIPERNGIDPAAEVARDHPPAGDDREILQHRLAPVAVFRRMDGGDARAALLVPADQADHAGGRHLLGDDQQRTPAVARAARGWRRPRPAVCSL